MLVAALALVALLVFARYANGLALKRATEFCGAVQAGNSIDSVREQARANGVRMLGPTAKSEYLVVFHGFVFDKALCRVRADGERVASAAAEVAAD